MAESTEEKLAKSTGEDTVKYADALEKEADDIINDLYNKEEDDDEKDKDDDKNDGTDKEPDQEDKDDGDDTGDDDEDSEANAEVKDGTPQNKDADDNLEDTIESLREQLTKSQKQVKDNKGEFTRRSQDLSEANKRSEHLEQNIFDLKNEVQDLKTSTGKPTTSKEKEEVVKSTIDIAAQLDAIKEVDPDIAKALTPVFQGLVDQVSSLQNEIKTNSEKATSTTKELLEDAHFRKIDNAHEGWEDVMRSDDFKDYVNGLSKRQKRLALQDLESGSAEDIIEVFSDYKSTQNIEDDGDVASKKKKKVDQARKIANPKFNKSKDTNTKAVKFAFTRSEIAAMSPEEFAKNEAAIDIAVANENIDRLN
jgi:hypothetical protein